MTTPYERKVSQKFRAFDVVKVNVKSPERYHFETNFWGIVAYSYRDKYGGESDRNVYCVIKLNKACTKAVTQIAWYGEEDLTPSNKISRKQVEKILKDLQWVDL